MQPLKTVDQAEFLVDHRLRAGFGQVDDRQPAVRQRDRAVVPEAVPVRAARCHHLGDRGPAP